MAIRTSRSGRVRPSGSGWELAIWYLMRLTGLGLFVTALAHYIIVHFVYDPTEQTAQWILDKRWGNIAWRTADWLMLVVRRVPCLHGHADDRPGLHDGWRPLGAHDAPLPGAIVIFAMGTMAVVTIQVNAPVQP